MYGPEGPGDKALCLAVDSVLATEFVNSTAGIDDLLLAGVKRMTRGTHFNKEILAERGTRREFVATTTSHLDVSVIGMNVGFHGGSPERATA
jgi:hypothetical protein